ncbi:MAG TPA: TIGR04282 family arsenosugar biosynthesis glycosyltransferase [Saprospiraceae bacterium]|nr:TIGR04282 family arsenosugar biosynthesis glycosyltransferase [Saprospiraceae bacterium]
MSAAAECGLIIFLRFPEKGKVKTRIASTLGDDIAFEAYQLLSDITLQLASELDVPVYLFYDGGIPSHLDKTSFHFQNQPEGDLGLRMLSAFHIVLKSHQKAIIIGSDCPEISKDDITIAFQNLDDHDIVIGPTQDGGYYLLGVKEAYPFLFDQIDWSTDLVFEQTIQRIKDNHKTFYSLRNLEDIDEGDQWTRFKEKRR